MPNDANSSQTSKRDFTATKLEHLNQDQLLCWVQVAIESFRQGRSLWEAMLECNANEYLGFDDDELILSKTELLEIAAWALYRARIVS